MAGKCDIRRGAGVVIGVVHLLPLPGSPRYAGGFDGVISQALSDAQALVQGGAHGVLVENFGDLPFRRGAVHPVTVAHMTRIAVEVRSAIGPGTLLGINVLRNDARAALSIAAAACADFIRVNVHTGTMFTDQGIIEGRAHHTLALRALLGTRTAILADVEVKHATPPAGFEFVESVRNTVERGLADAIIITGRATGDPADLERLRSARAVLPAHPILVGSGARPDNIGEYLKLADGAIVGTFLKEGGEVAAPVDPARVREFVQAASQPRLSSGRRRSGR